MSQFSLAFSPLVPLGFLLAFGVVALALVLLGFWARQRGAGLRAIALALLLFALADPSLVREDRAPLTDVVAVVLDRSASQTIENRRAQTDAARKMIETGLKGLENIEPRFVDGGADPNADGTQLFAALNAALADTPPERVAGAVLVTDGLVHDIPSSAAALGFKAPLHVFLTGREGERDRRIELVEAPRFGIVGEDQTIVARVLDTGAGGEPASIAVRRDGEAVATIQAVVGRSVRIPVRVAHGGSNVVELDVAPLPNELTSVNNKAVVLIEGVRDKLKVLLVSGDPNPGERVWRNLLKSDANVDLVHFTILRPPDKQDGTPINELSLIAFPTADLFGRKINDFDLIIFDRYSNQTVLPSVYFENIVRYVRNGGALLMATGPDYAGPDGLFYSALGKIAPARPDGRLVERAFRPVVTREGAKHPVTRGLSGANVEPPAWSPWFRQVSAETLRGVPIMAGAEDKPLILLSREGRGRVALMLSDQIWLWARGYDGGGPYIDLLRRSAHWLMKEPELEEEALRASARGHEIAIERQSLKDENPAVTLTAPSGGTQTVTLSAAEPGLARASLAANEMGLYRLTDGALSALVNVGPENPREFQEVVSTGDKLQPLVAATGGTIRRVGGVEGGPVIASRFVSMRDSPLYGGSDYVGFRRTGSSTVIGLGVAPLAVGFVGLVALLGSVIAGWLAEGRRRR